MNLKRTQSEGGEIMKNRKKMSAIEKTKALISRNLSGEKEIVIHYQKVHHPTQK